MGWLLQVGAGAAATIISAAMVYIAHRVDRFFRWCRTTTEVVDSIDRAGAALLSAAYKIEQSASRIERAAARVERAAR